jgi:hypothetical protein
MRKGLDRVVEPLLAFSNVKHLEDSCLSVGQRLAGQGFLAARRIGSGVSNWRVAHFARLTLTFLMKHRFGLRHSCSRASGYSRFLFGRLNFFPMLSCGSAERQPNQVDRLLQAADKS